MQQTTIQIRDKLLTGVDPDYNVVNMDIVVEVLSQLENFAITKEGLEASRLGKHINELRRRAQDRYLASRAKNLVKKWRQLLTVSNSSAASSSPSVSGSAAAPSSSSVQAPSGGPGPPPVSHHPPQIHHHRQAQQQQQQQPENDPRVPNSLLSNVGATNNHTQNIPTVQQKSSSSLSNNKHHVGGNGHSAIAATSSNNNGNHSLPSSTSTSPGLPAFQSAAVSAASSSRPGTPNERVPAGLLLSKNTNNKRLRKEMEASEDGATTLLMNGDCNNGAKRTKLGNNGHLTPHQDFLHDCDTRDSVWSHGSSSIAAPAMNNIDSCSSNPLPPAPNCDTTSTSSNSKLPPTATASCLSTPVPSESGGRQSAAGSNRKKKKSQRNKEPLEQTDILKQQMMSVKKVAGKMMTTQELVEEMALRSHSPGFGSAFPAGADSAAHNVVPTNAAAAASTAAMPYQGAGGVASSVPHAPMQESKTELMTRFLDSVPDDTSPPISRLPSPSDCGSEMGIINHLPQHHHHQLTGTTNTTTSRSGTATPAGVSSVPDRILDSVDEVMSKLPLIRASEVLEEIQNEELDHGDVEGLIPIMKPEVEITDELVEKLHSDKVENFNGNFDHEGEFREWHEVVTKTTVDEDVLFVLPYCVID